ncbi:MAG: cytochrome c maturation protein CcmE [Slackia piriformis]|uniref:Cytochrome c maturation protein CcmE n=1 Tax=Slackia piriformis TaxID=626934 RepID=A0A943YXV2_9ACTN|nr:cytochrome c maturation protein CcmE [Slackia piriformis]
MNTKTKRRLVVVTGMIVVVLAIVLAVVGSGGAAKTVSVADALSGSYDSDRIQVSGNVVDNSFATEDNVLTFDIYDPEGDASQTLRVRYEGAASSTFGNGVTAICTGKLSTSNGVELVASELVTKCPSKYESATDALTVARLTEYGESIVDTTVKLAGTVVEGTLTAAGTGEPRFMVADAGDASVRVPVEFDGALPESIVDGTSVVITGSLSDAGSFVATDVAQEG